MKKGESDNGFKGVQLYFKNLRKCELLPKKCAKTICVCVFSIYKIGSEASLDKLYPLKIGKQRSAQDNVQFKYNKFIRNRTIMW